MKKILIIGKKSFIGSNLEKYLSKFYDVDIIDFKKAYNERNIYFIKYSYVINTSIHKSYISKKYNKGFDLDRKFISKFRSISFNYIFLNTRKIYIPKENIFENSSLNPCDFYSKNKLKTEKYLVSKIKKNLISLRVSNIIGKRIYSKHRTTHKLFFDNFLKFRKKKNLTFENSFKDFLSIEQFSMILDKIIKYNVIGIYNVSLSKRVYLSEIVYWMDKKFHKKIKFINSTEGSFTLSNKKLIKKIKIKPTKKALRIFCENLF